MARTNSAVLAELRQKLAGPGRTPVSHQAIQQRRDRLQQKVDMPPDIANYIVARREGVRLHRHLDAETLAQVADFEGRLRAVESPTGGSSAVASPSRARRRPISASGDLRIEGILVPEVALSHRHRGDAERMARAYLILYAFENSVREFVSGHLTARYGPNWWDDPKIVNGDIRKKVERNRGTEKKTRYHSRRNAPPIYYMDLGDLPLLVQSEKGWKVFKSPLLPGDRWLDTIVEKVEASRNVVAHMNPVSERDIRRIKDSFQDWLDQIEGHGAGLDS